MTVQGGSGDAAIAGVGPEVFALTDEQIVGVEPEGTQSGGLGDAEIEEGSLAAGATVASAVRDDGRGNSVATGEERTATEGVPYKDTKTQEGPAVPEWLAERMKDPWHGEEAKEFWDGKQRAETEAAAYREVFATPADARALKELYPGGVSEAKSAAERARTLDEIDAAFYRGDSAARGQLAQRMMQQDPAAFREMVEAGIRLLGGEGKVVSGEERSRSLAGARDDNSGVSRGDGQLIEGQGKGALAGTAVSPEVARAYGEFERAANAELEKSVGGAIARMMEQALPNLRTIGATGKEGAQGAAPLQERLARAVREDVEAALKSDGPLSEQVARILSGKRFDEGARAQVVRLIDARAQQLVPGAVRRVVGSWTQATLGTRGSSGRAVAETARTGSEDGRRTAVAGARDDGKKAVVAQSERASAAPRGRRVDYRKFSDEEILGM